MEVSIDETKVKEWMNEFCSTYDSIGKIRSITTPTGKTASVSGGTYGWSVDEPEEIRKLIENIKSGERVEREPVYEKTVASHSQQDWGDTYVEVDLSTQHMWYIVNGSVQLETDIVTGLASDPNRATPSGVYSILEMKRDKVLTGETNPSTGEPIYRTKVSYWMRVTWTGIGFHDAIWQSAFGGNRYQTSAGSHGCINMPLDQAASLYDMLEMIYMGTLIALSKQDDGTYTIYMPGTEAGTDYDYYISDGVAKTAEMTYCSVQDDYGNGKNYIPSLKPGESVQVNMAWIVNEKDLENLYLNLNDTGGPYEISEDMRHTGVVYVGKG